MSAAYYIKSRATNRARLNRRGDHSRRTMDRLERIHGKGRVHWKKERGA